MGSVLPDGPLGGLLVIALLTLVVSAFLGAFLGALLHPSEVDRALRRLAHRFVPPPPPPKGPPIEQIARNARRLRGELAALPSGTPMAQRRGLSRAYDDLLCDACRALGIPDTLSGAAPGWEHDSERLHVEQELEDVGLRLSA